MLVEALLGGYGALSGGFALVATGATVRSLHRARGVRDPAHWPVISVLRPCEGDEPALAERLASTLRVIYPAGWELVVAHGGALPEAVRALAAADARVRLVASPPAPAACNRKAWHLRTALAAARDDAAVVLAIDADVEVTTELVHALVRAVMAPGVSAAFGAPLQSGDARSARVGRAALGGGPHAFAALAALAEVTGGVPTMVGCAVAARREALARVGGFERALGVIGDDLALGDALGARGRVALAPAVVDCVDPTQKLPGLLAQLARWVRVAGAHRPRVLWTYPLLVAPLPWLLALAVACMLTRGSSEYSLAVVAAVYAARVALALALRTGLYGRPGEALMDPLVADAAWAAAWVRAVASRSLRWRNGQYRVGRGGAIVGAGAARW